MKNGPGLPLILVIGLAGPSLPESGGPRKRGLILSSDCGPKSNTPEIGKQPRRAISERVSAMRAVLRGIESPDVDDISTFEPPGPSFSIPLQMIVGPAGSVGEESFDVVVCSPAWLSEKPGPVIGRHLLVVNSFQWKKIRTFLELQVGACEGEDWSEVAKLVGRIGHWEFEDYRP